MSIFDDRSAVGSVPVVSIEDARHTLPLADALLDSGLRAAQIDKMIDLT
jgi:2-keto-3-deoxy-6-phosphogluconate aldolase